MKLALAPDCLENCQNSVKGGVLDAEVISRRCIIEVCVSVCDICLYEEIPTWQQLHLQVTRDPQRVYLSRFRLEALWL